MIDKLPLFRGLRAAIWWRLLTPPLIAVGYLALRSSTESQISFAWLFVGFVISLASTASLGYFLNDWSDISADRIAGKANFAEKMPPQIRAYLGLTLALSALIPWVILPEMSTTLLLVMLEIVLLIVYSVRPLRFKERGFFGIVIDAAYGHVLPFLIAVTVFFNDTFRFQSLLTASGLAVAVVLMIKGVRNIIVHQLHDVGNDEQAQIKTFVATFGVVRARNLVIRTLVPLELLALAIASILLFSLYPEFVALYLCYLGAIYFGEGGRWLLTQRALAPSTERSWHPETELDRLVFYRWFPNSYYESWFPIAQSLVLAANRPEFIFVPILHLVVFGVGRGEQDRLGQEWCSKILQKLNLRGGPDNAPSKCDPQKQ